ncbi:NKG2-D type II integral membrane protein-like [Sparus aurata]|uniref:NKG2-D type II integral membrane protein-like n=1 Tax=Sparus aurata TaxID=8175 RepID=UPI0011C110F9|nr:NKG2-D type II integral membrane protein-like [Sparus aurata]
MYSNIYEDPDLTVNVRYNKGAREDRGESLERVVDIYESADTFTDHRHVDRSKQGRGAHTQEHRPAVKRGNCRTAASVLSVLCLLLLAGVIVLSKLYISEISKNSKLSQKEKQTSHDNLNDSFCHGWTRFRCSCYNKFTEKKNWTESRTDCQSSGADLVTITTKEEHDFVKNLTEHQASWIGLQSVMKSWKTEWQWVDGTTPKYVGFREGVDVTKLPHGHTVYMDEQGMWEYKDPGTKQWICERAIS